MINSNSTASFNQVFTLKLIISNEKQLKLASSLIYLWPFAHYTHTYSIQVPSAQPVSRNILVLGSKCFCMLIHDTGFQIKGIPVLKGWKTTCARFTDNISVQLVFFLRAARRETGMRFYSLWCKTCSDNLMTFIFWKWSCASASIKVIWAWWHYSIQTAW